MKFLPPAAACLALLASPALADTVVAAVPSDTTVVFNNALTAVLTLCVPPVAAILSGALWKLWTKWGFQASAQDKANLDRDFQTVLAYGVAKAGPAIEAKGWDHVDVHSEILADAANRFMRVFPDRTVAIAAAANTSPAQAVADALAGRLPAAIAAAAASPATPPAPVPAPPVVINMPPAAASQSPRS